MKKILIVCFIMNCFLTPVNAENWIIVNVNDSQVIDAKDEHDVRSIASITKIMTCLLALEKGDYTDMWIVGDEVLSAEGSLIYLEKGQQVSMRSLLYGLMLKSGNDASLVIARRVGGTVEHFVEMMNERAQEIGMKNTVFHNPHGLDVDEEGNYSTAYDMALLMSEAIQNPMFVEIVSTQDYISEWGSRWHNSNQLLSDFPFCIGGKTGYTSKAGRTLVTAARKAGAQYVIVTLDMQDRFEFHREKYEEVMNDRQVIELIPEGSFVEDGYEIIVDHPFEIVATSKEFEHGEMKTYLDKEKNEYQVSWYYQNHMKNDVYKASKQKKCFWRWCF